MLLFIAERPRHATTTGGDDMEVAVGEKAEHRGRVFDAYKGFLMAMAMQPYFDCIGTELFGGDVSSGHFAHDEFVVKQTVGCQFPGGVLHVVGHKVGVFVTERENTAGFYTHKGCAVGDKLRSLDEQEVGQIQAPIRLLGGW